MSNVSTDVQPLMSTYSRFPLTLVKGQGSFVWDDKGEQYLDFTSGIATCNLGHVPSYVKEKIEEQLGQLWHCSNLYHIPSQESLAALLVENSCFDQVFFCNSGAEANEGAIKLARKYAQMKGKENQEIVTFKQSFHGRTLATLTATGQEKIQLGFSPLVPGFRYLPYNDIEALEQLNSGTICAVLLELVQGEGGVIPAKQEWIDALVRICREKEILIMIDEIQTGLGRTGSLFCYQHYGFEPDVMTLAKGLGSGIPIGALLAKKEVSQAFEPGSHGSTFGGNPIATTAGLATLDYLINSSVLEKSKELCHYFYHGLVELSKQFSCITEIRGKGHLIGVVLGEKAAELVTQAREKKLLVLLAGPHVVRILPPLTATKDEMDQCLRILKEVLINLND